MTGAVITRTYGIEGGDFGRAGRVSTDIKDVLKSLGIAAPRIRRMAIAAYEAEMNVVMYAGRARVDLSITPEAIDLVVNDEGPGIPDIALAMREGYSTATAAMREMGFGAGMGLPNMRRNSDRFDIESTPGRGTRIAIRVDLT